MSTFSGDNNVSKQNPCKRIMDSVPTPRQLEYQDWELGVFLHFGIRTFHEGHRDWDGREKSMRAENFNPTGLDCRQWAASAAAAGARYMVFTAKHHDGFANWPSRYTDFSVASSPWRQGRGDVVRDYVDACREYGLKVGFYYSPADAISPLYEDPRAYDDYFINQISELLGGDYGPVDMLWFDGCGSENHQYDWERIVGEIRRMQPEILIFSLGDPDYRWVGNEAGLADSPQWNRVDELFLSVRTDKKLLSPRARTWLPAECDLMMRDCNWFFSDRDEHTVKSPCELLGIYDYSVGRGCNMLINIGPDRRGLLPEKDVAALLAMHRELLRRFASPIIALADLKRDRNTWSAEFPGYGRTDAGEITGTRLLEYAVIMEDIRGGESIRRFRIRIVPYINAALPITVYEGGSIGHKAICRFPPVRCRGVIFEVLENHGPVELRSLEFFPPTEG